MGIFRPALSGGMDWWRMEWPFSRVRKIFFRGRNFQENAWNSAERVIFAKFQAPKFEKFRARKMQFHTPSHSIPPLDSLLILASRKPCDFRTTRSEASFSWASFFGTSRGKESFWFLILGNSRGESSGLEFCLSGWFWIAAELLNCYWIVVAAAAAEIFGRFWNPKQTQKRCDSNSRPQKTAAIFISESLAPSTCSCCPMDPNVSVQPP